MSTESLTTAVLVRALRKVPEKKFSIVELAPQLLDDSGGVDFVKAMDRQAEVNLAVIEVESYVRASKELLRTLAYLRGDKVPASHVRHEEEDIYVPEDEA